MRGAWRNSLDRGSGGDRRGRATYADWFAANPGRPFFPDILKCMSLRSELLRGIMDLSEKVHFSDGHLTRRQHEMIATYVSALNQCPY